MSLVAELKRRSVFKVGVIRVSFASAPVGDLRCEPRFQAALKDFRVVDGLAPKMCKR